MNVNDDLFKQWMTFLSGRWMEETPEKEGRFKTATRQGWMGGEIVVYKHPETGKFTPATSWGDFWWSEPTPEMPPIPTKTDPVFEDVMNEFKNFACLHNGPYDVYGNTVVCGSTSGDTKEIFSDGEDCTSGDLERLCKMLNIMWNLR